MRDIALFLALPSMRKETGSSYMPIYSLRFLCRQHMSQLEAVHVVMLKHSLCFHIPYEIFSRSRIHRIYLLYKHHNSCRKQRVMTWCTE